MSKLIDETVFKVGDMILLQSGEYSDRMNTGLFCVKKEFRWKDIPAIGLYQERNRYFGDSVFRLRGLNDEFISEHMNPVLYYEMNTDFLHDDQNLVGESNVTMAEAIEMSRMKLDAGTLIKKSATAVPLAPVGDR